jgi:hypothetical protein
MKLCQTKTMKKQPKKKKKKKKRAPAHSSRLKNFVHTSIIQPITSGHLDNKWNDLRLFWKSNIYMPKNEK